MSAPTKEPVVKFPPFNLTQLLKTSFNPKQGERLCILIDLPNPAEIMDFKYLNNPNLPVQKKAYDIFYKKLQEGVMKQLHLSSCDIYAYEMTGGSNLDLPDIAFSTYGDVVRLEPTIFSSYDIILCITTYSATAPITAAAKQHGFRGATMHGMNDTIIKTGLAVDYNEVSLQAELLRLAMTRADSVDIDLEIDHRNFKLHIDLERQEAQKSHGICHFPGDIANLPAGEIYFVPMNAHGSFPIKFEEDGTLGIMEVSQGKVNKVSLIRGNPAIIERYQSKFDFDPATSMLGELGFGTQILPFAGSDIQDEKIFGTFHLATGRNDHLNGSITPDLFVVPTNATHEDILFSKDKTPEILTKQVRMHRQGKTEILIENNKPAAYLWDQLKK